MLGSKMGSSRLIIQKESSLYIQITWQSVKIREILLLKKKKKKAIKVILLTDHYPLTEKMQR